jgi:CDP-diacylglycerol---glycerol-3-phosphate 3-phosphatidyltransferase
LMLNNIPFATISFPFDVVATWLAVLITLVSGIDYFYKNRKFVNIRKSS